MTLVAPERATRPTREPALRTIPRERLAMQARQIVRVAMPGLREDSDLGTLVGDAVTAFVDAEGSCLLASRSLEGRMRELGALLADHDHPLELIESTFEAIHTAAQRSLQMTLGTAVSGHSVIRVRESIVGYLARLQSDVNDGWEERKQMQARGGHLDELRAGIFRGGSRLDHVLELSDLDPTDEFIALVSVKEPLPSRLLHDPEVLDGTDPREALIPTTKMSVLGTQVVRQAVISPPARLDRFGDSLDLARRGAALLRDDSAYDDRTIVPCTDLLGLLLLSGNRMLTDLLVKKHLGPLTSLGRDRRVHLGEMLLVWLETGQPIAAVARALSIAPQTAHSRAQSLRKMFGDDLDDPAARLELILALRAAVPTWRAATK